MSAPELLPDEEPILSAACRKPGHPPDSIYRELRDLCGDMEDQSVMVPAVTEPWRVLLGILDRWDTEGRAAPSPAASDDHQPTTIPSQISSEDAEDIMSAARAEVARSRDHWHGEVDAANAKVAALEAERDLLLRDIEQRIIVHRHALDEKDKMESALAAALDALEGLLTEADEETEARMRSGEIDEPIDSTGVFAARAVLTANGRGAKPYDIDVANKRQSEFYRSVGGRRAPEDEHREAGQGEEENDDA